MKTPTQSTQLQNMLTHKGVLTMLQAAVEKAESIGQPQCVVIVDASGCLLGEIRMTGAKFLSRKTAMAKALTSASHGIPSSDIPDAVHIAVGLATGGGATQLTGGLPIIIDNMLLGGIGVGSGSPEQDLMVATAGLTVV